MKTKEKSQYSDKELPNFKINIDSLSRTASVEIEEVGKTIEELLTLNTLIPAHTDTEILEISESQFDSKDPRWESEEVSERQLNDDRNEEKNYGIIERQLNNTKFNRDDRAWNPSKKEDKNTPPIWREIHMLESDRGKFNKNQLDKKK